MWRYVPVPKGIALAAFLMPWVTVSCSSQRIMTASGWQLATGSLSVRNPMTGVTVTQSGSASPALILALLLIVVGLICSIRRSADRGARVVAATSVGAAILIWLGTLGLTSEAIARKAAERSGEFSASMASMITVRWESGYWIASLALAAAAIMSFTAATGRRIAISPAERQTD